MIQGVDNVRRSVLTAILALIALVAPACGGDAADPTPQPTPIPIMEPEPTESPIAVTVTNATTPSPSFTIELDTPPRELLEASNITMQELDSLHIDIDLRMKVDTQGNSKDISVSFAGEFHEPDTTQGILSKNFFGAQIKYEFTLIGDDAYLKDPDTHDWQVRDVSLTPLPSTLAEIFRGPQPHQIEDLVLLGQETLNGRPVIHLMGTQAPLFLEDLIFAEGVLEGQLRVDIWIRAEDMLLAQMDLEGEVQIRDASELFLRGDAEGTGNLVMTMSFSRFGAFASIEAPAGVVEAAATNENLALESLLPTLAEMPEGLMIIHEGHLEDTEALRSYERQFGPRGISMGQDLSQVVIGMVVDLYANTSDARFAVEARKALDPAFFGMAARPESSEDTDSAAERIDFKTLDLPQLGDASAGFVMNSTTEFGDLVTYWLFFANGRIASQVVLVGPVTKVDLQQVVRLARLIEARVQRNSS